MVGALTGAAVVLLSLVGARTSLAAPASIAISGTVLNVDGSGGSGARVTICNPYTQNLNGGILRKRCTTLISASSGTFTTTNFVQGERVRVQVDLGPAQEVTLPFTATADLSATLSTTQNPPPTTVLSGVAVNNAGDYFLNAQNNAGSITLTPGSVFHFVLSQDSSAGSHKIANLACPTASGGALSWACNATVAALIASSLMVNDAASVNGNATINSNTTTQGLAANGPLSKVGNQNNGSDKISHVSVRGVFNVIDYGANSLGTADASAGAQAAILAACAAAFSPANSGFTSTPVVFFPPGVYWFQYPVINSCGNTIVIEGSGMYATGIVGKVVGQPLMVGPLFVTMPPTFVSSLGTIFGTSLATGSGNSLLWSGLVQGGQRFYLDIGDAIVNLQGGALSNSAPLNGLAQFDVRAFAELPSAAPTNTTYIWSSSMGAMDGQTGCSNAPNITGCAGAYAIGARNDGTNWNGIAEMKIGGTTYVLTGNQNNFAAAAIHEEELAYDGANIRLIVDGKLVAVQAATGTVTQRPDENMVLGGVGSSNESNSVASSAPWLGWLDSVQLSNTPRSTCAGSTILGATCYTQATAKFTGDSNTIFLTNFDQTLNPSGVLNSATQPGALIAADYTNGTSNGLAWMPLRAYNGPGLGPEQDFRDLGLNSLTFGFFAEESTLSTFANINSGSQQAGIFLTAGSFGAHIENWIGMASTAPFVAVQASGLTDIENSHLTCGVWCVLADGYLYLNHIFLQVPVTTLYGLVLQGGAVVTDLEPDTENCGGANLTVAALVVGSNETRFIGGNLSSCAGQPLMTVSPVNLKQVLLDGTTGTVGGSPAAYINVLPAWSGGSGLLQPIRWVAPNINGLTYSAAAATIPITNTGGNVNVGSENCSGSVALTSGTPSTATVNNKCIGTWCTPTCADQTAASAIKCVPSAGSLALTGPNTVTDTVKWACE